MGRVIAITNQKGGVGKTSSAINLAASLAILEKKTLIIDADPQANATSGIGINPKEVKECLYECLVGEASMKNAIVATETPHLEILPSHVDLVGAEIELINIPQRERIISKLIDGVREKYDYIIIDCSPSLGLITVNALAAADSVIIPVQAEYFTLEGLGKLLNTIKIVQKRINAALQIEGILITMFDSRLRLANDVNDEVRKHFEELVFETIIHRNTRIGEAPSVGKPVILFDASSKGAQDYLNLAREIMIKRSQSKETPVS